MNCPSLEELDELAYLLEEAQSHCQGLEDTYGKPKWASYKAKIADLLDNVEKDMEKAR